MKKIDALDHGLLFILSNVFEDMSLVFLESFIFFLHSFLLPYDISSNKSDYCDFTNYCVIFINIYRKKNIYQT